MKFFAIFGGRGSRVCARVVFGRGRQNRRQVLYGGRRRKSHKASRGRRFGGAKAPGPRAPANTGFRIRRRGIPSGGRKRRRIRRFRPRAPAKRRRSIQPALLRRRRGRIALRMSVPSSKSAAERERFCTGSDSRSRSRRRLRSAETLAEGGETSVVFEISRLEN